MKLDINPIENKRQHNKGMKALRQLIIDFNIPIEINWIEGRVIN